MEKLSENILDELVQQKLEGESYTRIRARLAEKGLSGEEIRTTIREVDERVLRAEIDRGRKERAKSWYWIGLALAITGLLFTIGSNAGWIFQGMPKWILYGPFFVGILLMYYGRRLQQKQLDPFNRRPERIRKKRPYK